MGDRLKAIPEAECRPSDAGFRNRKDYTAGSVATIRYDFAVGCVSRSVIAADVPRQQLTPMKIAYGEISSLPFDEVRVVLLSEHGVRPAGIDAAAAFG